MTVGFAAAFVGGMLALLSPCGALLLPSFFASRLGGGARLLRHGLVFYAGVAVVLVPLGAGAGYIGQVLATHREVLVIGTAVLLVAVGIAQATGWGFDVSRLIPGSSAAQARAGLTSGVPRTFLLGLVGGVAGFCAGPILGAVLTLAANQAEPVLSSGLLATYAAGIVVPMMGIAAAWDRMGARGQRLLRGRSFTWAGRSWHTTSVVTGALMVALGITFWITNGLVSAPSVVPWELQSALQEFATNLDGAAADIALVLVATGGALLVWRRSTQRRAERTAAAARADRSTRAAPAPGDGS